MKLFLKICLSLVLIITSLSLIVVLYINKNLPTPNILGEKIISGGTEFFDRSGTVLLYKIGLRRTWVDFDKIPPLLVKAFLVAEDEQFYEHPGISLRGILRSIFLNIKNRSLTYGGSTITQQLTRNLFLTQEKTFIRKIKEILLAIKIEKNYSKEKILTYYLNSIYFGAGNVGIKAAADFYFNKKLENLSLSEMAVLAAIPKSPSIYAPLTPANIIKTKERRDFILKKMKDAKIISPEEYVYALNEEIKIQKFKYTGLIAPHFIIETINFIKSLPLLEANENLENSNLKIITTLDLDIQKIAEKTVKEIAEKNKKNYGGANAALMAINPKTGEIIALVGSKDFNDESIDGQVNVPFRLRQPGSAFKPIAYASLFELGYPPETIIFDLPTNFGNYKPKNFDNKFKGPVSLRQALAESRNIPSVKVFYLAMPDKVFELAKKTGMTYLKDWQTYGLSAALGAAEARMADLIRFYGALANDGKLTNQTFVLKIIKERKIIYEHKVKEEQIISTETARMVNDILKDIEARKGLFSRSLSLTIFPGYEVALKTGTTQFYQDAWAFAYTPNFVVGVWSGNTDGKRMASLGSSLVAALPIVHNFLKNVIAIGKISPEKFITYQKKVFEKPMLNGEYFSDYGIHDILFYVDRYNPLGPMPSNPNNDPQFYKWEQPVKQWANNSEIFSF